MVPPTSLRSSLLRWPGWFLLSGLLIATLFSLGLAAQTTDRPFRAGAAEVDISPARWPVIVNAMFTERSADKVVDPLMAKALVLDDGTTRLALCVVDSCMVPRELLDRAKSIATAASGIAVDHMLISSTHTHSAPSAMGCLGSRVDPIYAASLPPKIADAILRAASNVAPARVAWTSFDDWDHTFNRRWIRRPDRLLTDPFGQTNVRAHMHPGYQSPDAIGPSGPVDPGLSVLALTHTDGRPLAVFANYSQHYYGSPLVSSDYYGRFARHLAERLGADPSFVGIMSQGTSGDQMWMDYGAPAREIGYDAYAQEIASRVHAAYTKLTWHTTAPLRMAERKLELGYRVPDEARLAWARQVTQALGDRLPQSLPEIYAWESIYLHDRPRTELKLQAIRIGDLGIAAWPNEVFALSGLKVKAASPLKWNMNVELANGAEGYIPPPEQHALGGYTTWAARTAGLEVQAEPRIVETLLALLEEVAGQPRRPVQDEPSSYAQAVLATDPAAYWRLNEMSPPTAHDASSHHHSATIETGVAMYLPGPGSGTGISPTPSLTPSNFAGKQINRAPHFAGGRMRTELPLGTAYSVEAWIWNGLPSDARPVTGYLFSRGTDRDTNARGDHLGLGGTFRGDLTGKLIAFNGNERNEVLVGRTSLALKAWHHVVWVREGAKVRVYLDGHAEPEIDGELTSTVPAGENTLFFGGRNDGLFGWEGRLDEIAVYDRALTANEIRQHYQAAGLKPPVEAAAAPAPASLPLLPQESLAKIHVRPGYHVELAAAEPLTLDPVAIDWDAAGRLWVVEMADYPLGVDGKGKAGGRVRILEDTNGDGIYDRSTIFAEGLNFPNGLLTWRDGVLVTAAPDVLFLRDTDGDGRADQREVLVTGLQEGNQQLRANGLRWGLDNWVYCAAGGHHGGYGVNTRLKTPAGEFVVGSRDFRFRPDTGALEPQSGPSQFGRNRDDFGHWFGTQNIRPLWHYVLTDSYLRRNPHVAAPDPTHLVVVPLSPKVYPASPPEKRFHSFNEAGHFTSACSGMIYRDDLLFPDPAPGELNAFTCEPFHNLVQHNVVVEDGVSFRSHRAVGEEAQEFFASEDRWCRPVMVRTGPDGALWVVDMYRYMIEHPDWLPAEGKAELLPHYRLGEDRGRIYRVVPNGKPVRKPRRLDTLPPAELVAALDSSNEWQRDKAHQLLVQHADPAALGPLHELARTSTNPLARLHAWWVLEGQGALTAEEVVTALGDAHAGLRENAVRLAERHPTPEVRARAEQLIDDPSAKVRLQLAFTLGEWPEADAGAALGKLAVRDYDEPFLRAAILSSAVPHCRALANAAVQAGNPALQTFAEPLANVALAISDRAALAALLEPALTPGPRGFTAEQAHQVSEFLATAARRGVSLNALGQGNDALSQEWQQLPRLVAWATPLVTDATAPVSTRAAAAEFLVRWPETQADVLQSVQGWIDPTQSGELQKAGIQVLALSAQDSIPRILIPRLNSLTPETQSAALDALLSREAWVLTWLQTDPTRALPPLNATRREQLLKHPSKAIRELASQRLQPASNRAQVIEAFRPALQLTGNAQAGQALFRRLCVGCHQFGQEGHDIGPNLRSVVDHPPEKLLTNILDPSADVQPGYNAYRSQLTDGSEVYGLIAAETANSLSFKLADNTVRVIPRSEIQALHQAAGSLMPEGLEVGLRPQDLADLIQFLRSGALSEAK